MIDTYINWLSRWRYGLIFLILVLVIWAASGMRFLQFKSDYRMFFSEDNPQLLAFEKLQDTYTKSDNVLFAIAPKDGKVFTVEVLAMLEQMTEMAWQMPYSSRVDSIANFQYSRAVEDDIIVEDLISEAEQLTASQIQEIKKIAINEPLLINNLISPKAHVTGINVILQLPDQDQSSAIPNVVKFARDLAAKMRDEYPNIDIYLTGGAMMDNAFGEISAADMQKLVPIMFVVLLITLGLLLGTISGVVSTTIIIIFSIIATLGLAGWLGISMSPPTAPLPNIIMILAVADSVHLDYSIESGNVGGINDPKFLIKLDEFVNWFRQQAEVRYVYSITEVIKRLNKNMHGDDPSWYKLPEARELTAQYLLFYEMSLPYGLDLNDRLNVDKSATRITVIFINICVTFITTRFN
jgi:predicted RND superfamily exporter protein